MCRARKTQSVYAVLQRRKGLEKEGGYMIGYLEGTVRKTRKDHLLLQCGPIGFIVYVPGAQSYAQGSQAAFYTHQQFKEDGQTLYGFESEELYELFVLLIQVKGLGCKTVLNMLSSAKGDSIIRAIETGDATALKKLPGIGAKTAGQILLDLKGKITVPETKSKAPSANELSLVAQEVCDALLSLGYRQPEVDSLRLAELEKEHSKTDELLRFCLRELARRKKGV